MRTTSPVWCLLFVVVAARSALAGVIVQTEDQPSPAVSTVRGDPFIALANGKNDDNQADPSNFVSYFSTLHFVSVGYVDTVFTVAASADASGDTTEYLIDQTIVNSTGLLWIGYRLELGFGTGAAFVRMSVDDGLDFDVPDAESASAFNSSHWTISSREADVLRWGDGGYPSGFEFMQFTIDVPDMGPGEYTFTLRQFPLTLSIPEPTSAVALLILCVLTTRGTRRNDRSIILQPGKLIGTIHVGRNRR